MRSTKSKSCFFKFDLKIRRVIYSFQSAQDLYMFSMVSYVCRKESQDFVKSMVLSETLFEKNGNINEMWEILKKLYSKRLEDLLSILFTAICINYFNN